MPEEPVPLSQVQGDVIHIGEHLRLQNHVDARPRIVVRILLQIVILVTLGDEVVHVVLQEGHVGQQQVVGPLGGLKVLGIPEGEVE